MGWNPLEYLWGKLTRDEFYRLSCLSSALFLIIKSYWILKILRDTMFETLIGLDRLPTARIVSVFINLPMVLGYGKLVEKFAHKEYILYLILGLWSILFFFIGIAALFVDVTQSGTTAGEVLGWFTFFSVETFGSLSIAGFWAYISGCVGPESSRRLFPIINTVTQFGSIFGPIVAGFCIVEFGFEHGVLFAFCYCSTCLFLSIFAIFQFAKTTKKVPPPAPKKKKKKSPFAFIGGLQLVLSNSYVLGILFVSTIYHIDSTICDYMMKRLAKLEIPDPAERTEFMASFGFCTNVWSFAFSLMSSFLLREFGLTLALVFYPLVVIGTLCWILFQPTLSSLFVSLVVLKGLSYALNNPAKEALYVKLTDDVRYQAKSWIDMCGQRVAKGVGATITQLYQDLESLLFGGTLISLGFSVVWVFAAFSAGKQYESSGETVFVTVEEKEKEKEKKN